MRQFTCWSDQLLRACQPFKPLIRNDEATYKRKVAEWEKTMDLYDQTVDAEQEDWEHARWSLMSDQKYWNLNASRPKLSREKRQQDGSKSSSNKWPMSIPKITRFKMQWTKGLTWKSGLSLLLQHSLKVKSRWFANQRWIHDCILYPKMVRTIIHNNLIHFGSRNQPWPKDKLTKGDF